MLEKIVNAACALLVVTVLSGCAFGTREPTLIYPPAPESGTAAPTPTPGKMDIAPNGRTIVLANFRDERSDKTVVGTVRNGFGMRTADVVPTNNVSQWVTQAVGTELRSSGYKVVSSTVADPADFNSILVSGDILNVFCDMYMSYTGQVSLIAKASKGSGELLTKHYAGEGSAGLAFAATGESYAQSLALALRDALRKFIADLDARLAEK